ncbi:MAG TPA: glucoamylase family protein [Thermotogota bacterium]|nr:glucoamylase family protein [Thermotogota bacterium]
MKGFKGKKGWRACCMGFLLLFVVALLGCVNDGGADFAQWVTLTVRAEENPGGGVIQRQEAFGKVRINQGEWGITKSETLAVGSQVTVEAAAEEGWHFLGWFRTEVLVSENTQYQVVVDTDQDFTARFVEDSETFPLTARATPPSGGNVRINGESWGDEQSVQIQSGSQVTLEAAPVGGWSFLGWFDAGEKVGDDAQLVFTCEEERELFAHFAPDIFWEELEKSFDFFWEQVNTTSGSSGYGLVRDRYPGSSSISSIAATGFGLASIPVGVEEGWISYSQGEDRVSKTLDTLLDLETHNGFFFHFLDIQTGEREWECEISSVDTCWLLCGVLVAGEYFAGEIAQKASLLFDRVNWKSMVDAANNQFYMAYSPENGYQGHWDFTAEQLALYILGAGASNAAYRTGTSVYDSFTRHAGSYNTDDFFHSWFGSIFTYQYSHAFLDFRGLLDRSGVDWFENSTNGCLANLRFCRDNSSTYAGFDKGWGLTACDDVGGYNGFLGAPPSGDDGHPNVHQVNGTIATSGALGSVNFLCEEAFEALEYYYTIPQVLGTYGLKDSFNQNQDWYASDFVGIDKGITLLMFANFSDGLIWELFMRNEYVSNGLQRLGFTSENSMKTSQAMQ